jgi:putative transport protein
LGNIGAFLDSQTFIALFLVIGLGYAAGRISLGGFALGSGAILFIGLAVGAIAPKAAPPGFLGVIGLVVFLYGMGIQYGKDFFKGLASPFGIKANILAAVAVVAGCAVAFWMAHIMGFEMDFAAGMFGGTMTSTASLQAALNAAGNANPATGYAIAYPFGVLGPILCFFLFKTLLKPKIEVPAPGRLVVAETRADERGIAGLTISEVLPRIPKDVGLLMIRRAGSNMLPDPSIKLEPDDILSITGLPDTIGQLKLGNAEEVRNDRRDFDYVLCFVSKPKFVGMKLSDLPTPKDFSARVVQVRRGDVELVPHPGTTIEYGDQLGVLVEPKARDRVRSFFGDSIKAESEFSFVSLGLGFVLGGLVGLIPIPIPGIGSVTLGVAGGPLVVALILGYRGRLGPFNWNIPVVANTILRNFGFTLFLASVGMSSGAPFVENIGGSGISFFLAGICVLLTTVLIVLLVGYYVLRMNFDELLGVASGTTGNPAILAYANQLAPTDRVNLSYAMIFPGVGTIVKVVAVQVMVALGAGGIPPG